MKYTTTRKERREWIHNNAEEIGKKYMAASAVLLASVTLAVASFFAWGFGAENMIWVGVGLLAVVARAQCVIRREIHRDAENSLKETPNA